MTFSLLKKSLPDREYPAEESAYLEVYQKQDNKSSMCISSIQMRHTSFFDEIVDRGHLIERLMNSSGEIEKHILCELFMEE